ncbi:cytochrome P450 3A21-like [Littorina saxatilis]|uniref:Cytochrome P450 n=1 Tax=Littorina saxatilis TaxID=31220 RepID=A0AAN9BC93_9CAEN
MVVETLLSWAVPAFLFLMTLLLFYLYGSWTHSVWRQVGVPGPQPTAFFGNIKDLARKGVFASLLDWNKAYGKTYGIYMFRRPFLITTDLDILKEVFIKDFNNFTARGNPQPLQEDLMKRSVLLSDGDIWRRQRHTLTPTFSASKLKHMNMFIGRCCTNLVNSLRKSTLGKIPIDVKETFGSFTLDVIAGTGFGFETNCLEEKDNVFLVSVRGLINLSSQFTLAGFVASIFPALEPVLKALGFGTGRSTKKQFGFIVHTIRTAIEERKRETEKGRVDILQLMVDAEASEEDVLANPNEKRLSTEEIVAQGIVLFFAGYETTATTLQYLSYVLALNPDKQEKLHDEIVAAIGDDEPSYENVNSISYLDSCIRETMRCFPPVPMFGRRAIETRTIKGVTIPAGSSVMAAAYALMRDEEYFPEPEKFTPERFEKDSQDQIPTMVREMVFGAGPRQCIGMRLALYEAKMAAVAVIRKFKFVKIKETPDAITYKAGAILSMPTSKILVGTQLRE